MLSQGFDCVIAAGEIGFRKGSVDFAVADLMKQNSWTSLASAQPGDQVVLALGRIIWNWAQAERANRVFHEVEFAQ